MTTYKLAAPFEVFTRVATTDSNTWFGSARVCGNVFRKLKLRKGTLLFDWPGGTFALVKGEVIEVQAEITEKHPFEKSYFPAPTFEWVWRNAKLTRVADPASTPPVVRSKVHLPMPVAGAKICKNGVDWLLDEVAP